MSKSEAFNTELNYIRDDEIRESARYLLDKLPDYFYIMPASTSGKYHPEFSLGDGGLVRHTKAAVRIAVELFKNSVFNKFEYGDKTQDLIIMALLLHDGYKQGIIADGHTAFDHPLLVANFIFQNITELPMDKLDVLRVSRMVSSHMGPWNTDKDGKKVMPLPRTDDEIFVHLCDYMASRIFLNITFVDNEIVDSVDRIKIKKLEK